jgi:hypothetical protein
VVTSSPRFHAPCDHVERESSLTQGHASDVNDVNRRAGDRCPGDHLLNRLGDRAGFERARRSHVHEYGDFAIGGDAQQVQNLRMSRHGT